MCEMHRITVDGQETAYQIVGDGEPVVLIHAGCCAAWFDPLLKQPSLTSRYEVISYHRPGYGDSAAFSGPVTTQQQARHCYALMNQLGIQRAHVVGHSNGGMIALQLALDFPDAVQSIVSLESARPAGQSDVEQAFLQTVAQPAVQTYSVGDKDGALDAWMRGVAGSDYRGIFEAAVPGAFDQATAAADTFFGQELPAVRQWVFTREDAQRIRQPVLLVLGEWSIPTFAERRRLLAGWLPNAETFDLPGANHLLHIQNPTGIAEVMASFFARYPISGSA